MTEARPIDPARYSRIVVLTGAGISVASGLRPFRGPGGLWTEGGATASMADSEHFARDPAVVWSLFGPLRAAARAAQPNAAHRALALAQQSLEPGRSLTVVTQNIDGLHQRAGSTGVIELHGSVHRTRCSGAHCTRAPFHDETAHTGAPPPLCAECGAALRPDVVLFGEAIPVDAEWAAKKALRECDLFIAVGTSGTVTPAASFVRWAEYEGAETLLVNLEPMSPRNAAFRHELLGRAEDLLPRLFNVTAE